MGFQQEQMSNHFAFWNKQLQRTGSEVIASHIYTLAGDYGKDAQFNFDVKLVKKDSGAYTLFFESAEPLLLANGEVDYISMSFGHMDDKVLYDKYPVGSIIPAGELAYKLGTRSGGKNGAVGAHMHVRIHKGKFKPPCWENTSTGNWDLTTTGGKMHHYDAFFITPETEVIKCGNPADNYPYVVYTGQESFISWEPVGAKLEIKATQVNRRETPSGTKLSGGYAPVGIYPIVEATKDFVGDYLWVRCEGFDGWVALMENATIWIDTPIKEPKPPVEEGESEVIEELKRQVALLEEEMKAKDDRITYLEKAASDLEKELDAIVISANEKQKKINEVLKILGG